ncbi:MAG TPA: Trk system potassium transporter TrkA [Acidobacteriota bacterium]|nr:Trk system potassium transporter TrkA [Acidobacteriota bacterium]
MRILILGGGAVGTLVARRLIGEKNEVTIVEKDEARCVLLQEMLDAKIVQGSASSISALERADLAHAEMLIAVTNSDETNILSCLIAQAHSNVKIKVARLRTHEVDRWNAICGQQYLNIDRIIHPDRETAERILKVLRYPGISAIHDFAEGAIRLFAMGIEPRSWLVGKSLAELGAESPTQSSLIAMILRGHNTIIPTGVDRLQVGDQIYVAVPASDFNTTLDFLGITQLREVERVFIVGGKQLGIEVALQLEKKGVAVKLFERDLARCQRIAEIVSDSVVVNGDGTDQQLLLQENIQGVDAYLALTGDDEVNMIASMLAKRLGATKVAALVNRPDFIPVSQLLGISATFSSRLTVVDRILQFIRKGRVVSVTSFNEEQAEAIELIASAKSRLVNRKLKDVHLPKGVIVGAIGRPSGEVIVPRGNDIIHPGDRVVFFALERLVPALESEFILDKSRGNRWFARSTSFIF